MGTENDTTVTVFIILELTEDTTICGFLFIVFSGIYVVTLMGNVSIIMIIGSSPQPHAPVYLFLCHLAFIDIDDSSSVTPAMLTDFLRKETSIRVAGCVAQLCSTATFGLAECFLLAIMGYDHSVAICSPLLSSTHMSPRISTLLVGMCYLGGYVNAWTFTSCLLSLSFCGPNKVNHFFCDYSLRLKLSCSHEFTSEIIPAISSCSIIVVTVFIIVLSYVYILLSTLKIHSTNGCHQAFSACTSHLTVVTLFYGTPAFIYVMPTSSYSAEQNKVVFVFCVLVIPMLNTLIYSMRNKEVKEPRRKWIEHIGGP
ncbi:unnamed protein product, partial [Pipistrellus nathusii]